MNPHADVSPAVPHLFAELEELSRRLSPSPPARGSERVGKGTVPSHSRETASTSTIRKGASPAILPTSTFSQRETSIGGPSDALSPMVCVPLTLMGASRVLVLAHSSAFVSHSPTHPPPTLCLTVRQTPGVASGTCSSFPRPGPHSRSQQQQQDKVRTRRTNSNPLTSMGGSCCHQFCVCSPVLPGSCCWSR